MMIRSGLIAVAALAGSAALAQAPVLGDSAKGVIGSWEFSNADRDKICTATFKSDPTPVGFKVEFDKNCVNLFPIVASVAGWVFPDNDLLRLLDAQKKTLIEFSEVEDNIYEAPTPGLGVIFLQSAAAAEPAAKAPEQVAGDWTIVRANGAPLCQVSLGHHGGRRQSRADGQAGLRGFHCSVEFHAMAHRSRRTDADRRAWQSVALRSRGRCELAAAAGKRQLVHAGEAVVRSAAGP